MSKAVLISIRPKWCKLIASGEKTVEVRKTAPKLSTPFKCYIYQTLSKSGDWNERDGRVIGEFICDAIYQYTLYGETFSKSQYVRMDKQWYAHPINYSEMCLTPEEFAKYADGRRVYGWHISGLAIYDKPKELREFFKWYEDGDDIRPCQNGKKCEYIIYDYYEDCEACAIDFDGTDCPHLKVTRPPQSWMYVEEQ